MLFKMQFENKEENLELRLYNGLSLTWTQIPCRNGYVYGYIEVIKHIAPLFDLEKCKKYHLVIVDKLVSSNLNDIKVSNIDEMLEFDNLALEFGFNFIYTKETWDKLMIYAIKYIPKMNVGNMRNFIAYISDKKMSEEDLALINCISDENVRSEVLKSVVLGKCGKPKYNRKKNFVLEDITGEIKMVELVLKDGRKLMLHDRILDKFAPKIRERLDLDSGKVKMILRAVYTNGFI